MSFHSLKETLLRPCSASTSTSTSTSSSLSHSQPSFPLRKPPKSSLAHQLLRLDPIPSLLLRNEPTPTADYGVRDSPLEPPVPSQFLPRKPPKSSLSQQLQRLDLPEFSPPLLIPKRNTDKAGEEEEDGEEEREEVADVRVNWKLPVAHSGIETRGPYEPLVLSAPGEGPLVQVVLSVLCFLNEI